MSLFCSTELAARIERAEADLIAKASGRGRVMPVAGGVASFVEPGSPLNKVAGLGFGGVPNDAELEQLEQLQVPIELCHLGDPAIGARLTARGYQLVAFENVLGLALPAPPSQTPEGVEIRPSDEAELDEWLQVVVDGFAHPDTQGVPSHEEFPREIIARAVRDMGAAGAVRYLARREGVTAGGASLRLCEGVAHLAGAATAPAHRRRGVQSALLSARLQDAARAGCDVAVITTQPGSKSQQNAQRRGFDLLYTRAVLVR